MTIVAQGGTVTLNVLYEDGTGALVDPASPLLSIVDADGSTVASGLVPTRLSQGQYYCGYSVPSGAVTGTWEGRFTGLVNSALVTGDDPFDVISAGVALTGTVDILSLDEFKQAWGKSLTDTSHD